MVLKLAEDGVAELAVEVEGLGVEGIEPEAGEAASAGDGFGLAQEAGTQPLAAEVLGDEEQLDEEPLVGAAAPEAAYGEGGFVLEEQTEELNGGIGGKGAIVIVDGLEDELAIVWTVFLGVYDGGWHGGVVR